MEIMNLAIDGKTENILLDHVPSVSWRISSQKQNVYQKAYTITVTKGEETVWTSGTVESRDCIGISCGGAYLPFSEYQLQLSIVTEDGDTAAKTLSFQTGRMNRSWAANWITGSGEMDDDAKKGTYLFRKAIHTSKPVRKAFLTASALGCYDLYANGRLLCDRYFAPGYTQYTRRVQYQSYDVTDLFAGKQDINLGAEVSGGWYSGRLGLVLDGNRFGKKRAFAMELTVLYADGSEETFATDESWQVSTSAKRTMASFFDGEDYNAGASESQIWETTTVLAPVAQSNAIRGAQPFDETNWQCLPEMVEDLGEAVIAHEIVRPKILSQTAEETIFDAGRNLAGIVCFENLKAPAGAVITVKHGEVLDQGKVYTGNLRTARASLVYTCREGVQSYEPRFTFMGFRYFSVSSDRPVEIREQDFYVKELYSDMDTIGHFSCSNLMLNQLQQNILTSQKANFIDIPTDCPQRDERCGWTGDISAFASTALYNMDCGRFLQRWLKDVNILQEDNGKGFCPYVVPDNAMGRRPGGGAWGNSEHSGSDAVWGDAAVILPWNMYLSTGNVQYLRESYAGMKAQVDYVRNLMGPGEKDRNYIWKKGFQLGDWLAPGENVLKNMLKAKWTSTAYWANSAHLVAQAAKVLGYEADAEAYEVLNRRICTAFRNKFVRRGHIHRGFQTAYTLSICFSLLEEDDTKCAAGDLVADVRKKDNHLSTGFVGTPYLPFALSDTGNMDVAYDLLLQDTFPSWLYPVKAGATSIWERWDSLKEYGTINAAGDMVSFNHYSYGAVGDFLYRRVCGLELLEPGYRKFRVAPMPGGGITWAKTTHECPYGQIEVSWKQTDGQMELSVQIPANTTAVILLPSGKSHILGSGVYQFTD